MLGQSLKKIAQLLKVGVWQSAGGVVINSRNQILLREPTNHFGGAAWTFPKGKIDKGETVQEAALREVLEETGYSGTITQRIGSFLGTSSITTYFLMINPKKVGNPDSETNSLRWVSLEEASNYLKMSPTQIVQNRDLKILEKVKEIITQE